MRQVVMHGTALVLAVTAGACSTDDAEQPTDRSGSPTGRHTGANPHDRRPVGRPAPDTTGDQHADPITIGDQRFTATLDDSAAADDSSPSCP